MFYRSENIRGSLEFLKNTKSNFHPNKSLIEHKNSEYLTYSLWRLQDYTLDFGIADSILGCELNEKGNGMLLTTAENEVTHSPCQTVLIKEGIIKHLYQERYLTADLYTFFIIPETCYDMDFENELLPDFKAAKEENEEVVEYKYAFSLSPYQIPVKRYMLNKQPYYQQIFTEIPLEQPTFNPKIHINKPGLIASPIGLLNVEDENLEFQRRSMVLSSAPTRRIDSSRVFMKIPIQNKKPQSPKISISINPDLLPRKVEECEIYQLYQGYISKDLKDHCSYAYQDHQFSLFEKGTNHVLSGRLLGSFIIASYFEKEEDLNREMLMNYPQLFDFLYTIVVPLSFACLYPPEDEEKWKKYAVCTCPFKKEMFFEWRSSFADISKELFMVWPEGPEGYCRRPYCVAQIPYNVIINNNILSFCKYLPSETGDWVDIEKEEVKVYTQIRLCLNNHLEVQDMICSDDMRKDSRTLIGCPKRNGNELGDYNCLWLTTQFGELGDDNIIEHWITWYEHVSPTPIYNDFAYLSNVSCTPTDFLITNKNFTKKDKNENGLIQELYILRNMEIIHKLK